MANKMTDGYLDNNKQYASGQAMTVRGFIYDVDTGKLEEVRYPGPMGSIG